MEDHKDSQDRITDNEDDINATKGDRNATEKPADDGFKTSTGKHKLEWTQPPDEQMFEDTDLSKDNDQ